MNNSNPEVSIREDGLIEVLSDSPGTRTISVSIIDNRNSTSPNATGHCSSFQTDLLIEVLKNETTGKVWWHGVSAHTGKFASIYSGTCENYEWLE